MRKKEGYKEGEAENNTILLFDMGTQGIILDKIEIVAKLAAEAGLIFI